MVSDNYVTTFKLWYLMIGLFIIIAALFKVTVVNTNYHGGTRTLNTYLISLSGSSFSLAELERLKSLSNEYFISP